jgi:ankyrin repeat protein
LLALAASHGDADLVRQLLESRADVEERTAAGRTPLMLAAVANSGDAVDACLAWRANVESTLCSSVRSPLGEAAPGDTALHLAARHDCGDAIAGLVKARANLEVACYRVDMDIFEGMTALHLAARHDCAEALAELMQANAAIDSCTTAGYTALNLAASHGMQRAVRLLLCAMASPEVCDSGGKTPLMHACQRRAPEMVRLLLDARANPFRFGGNGRSAFQELLVEVPIHDSISLLEDCLDSLLIMKTDKWRCTRHVYFRCLDTLRVSGALGLIVERYQVTRDVRIGLLCNHHACLQLLRAAWAQVSFWVFLQGIYYALYLAIITTLVLRLGADVCEEARTGRFIVAASLGLALHSGFLNKDMLDEACGPFQLRTRWTYSHWLVRALFIVVLVLALAPWGVEQGCRETCLLPCSEKAENSTLLATSTQFCAFACGMCEGCASAFTTQVTSMFAPCASHSHVFPAKCLVRLCAKHFASFMAAVPSFAHTAHDTVLNWLNDRVMVFVVGDRVDSALEIALLFVACVAVGIMWRSRRILLNLVFDLIHFCMFFGSIFGTYVVVVGYIAGFSMPLHAHPRHSWELFCLVAALFGSWMGAARHLLLVSFRGWCPGTYLRAVSDMLVHVVQFSFIYLFITIPYTLATHVLFNDIADFQSPQTAFMTLLESMHAGGNYRQLCERSLTGCAIYISYLVVGALLLLTMVAGLVSNSFGVTRERAEVENNVYWARFVLAASAGKHVDLLRYEGPGNPVILPFRSLCGECREKRAAEAAEAVEAAAASDRKLEVLHNGLDALRKDFAAECFKTGRRG